ncbi:hypothetical protein PF005_g9330 [Phytophthora fragariae]|nr:hypothetical protein PF003_g32027 [Phytophthora fragariae]KAE9036562.1 hypothetical protein PR002_g7020 [Phytophthora rubi]KAE8939791.1 hypothetical protein PF009_g10373 [Phytophthora fragariae]KAE9117050.1 hypothetical protein PF007_g9428 [Phytophthora fragariae]KAE9215709.1 hypothetical protein PF005_g9330 [Phytophthora fragariae]
MPAGVLGESLCASIKKGLLRMMAWTPVKKKTGWRLKRSCGQVSQCPKILVILNLPSLSSFLNWWIKYEFPVRDLW